VQIPVFKKAVDKDVLSATSNRSKPLPALAPVQLNHSCFGLLLYRCSYAVFALSLILVFYPFIFIQPVWLLALAVSWWGLWWAYRQKNTWSVIGLLEFRDGHWQLEQDGRTCQLELAGEVVCWPWLIILSLREITDHQASASHQSDAKHKTGDVLWLVIFGDALSSADNARLRRWLRACLIPQA
jgi:hypothetical protein